MKIKRINVQSAGKMSALLYAFAGLILGIIMTAIALTGIGANSNGEQAFGAVLGAFGIIVFPLLYGAMGYVGGLLVSALYNLASKWIGGLEIEVEQ